MLVGLGCGCFGCLVCCCLGVCFGWFVLLFRLFGYGFSCGWMGCVGGGVYGLWGCVLCVFVIVVITDCWFVVGWVGC